MEKSRRSDKYAWIVCIGCVLSYFTNSGLAFSGFSSYQPFIVSVGGLTNAQASMIVMLRNAFAIVGVFLLSIYYKKLSYRKGIALSVTGQGISFIIFAFAKSHYPVYLAAAVLSGVTHTLGGIPATSVVISRWFRDRRGLASGLVVMGSSVAIILTSPLIPRLIQATSLYRTFLIEGAAVIGLSALVFLFIKDSPEKAGREAYAIRGCKGEKLRPQTFGGDISKLNVALMCIVFAFLGTITNTGFSYYYILFTTSGFSVSIVSSLIMLTGIVLLIAKAVNGHIFDVLGGKTAAWLFFVPMIVGNFLCCFSDSRILSVAIIAVIFLGIGDSLGTVGMTVFSMDMSSKEKFPTFIKWMQLSLSLGSMIYSPVPGILADRTGSYVPTYRILTVFAVLSLVLIMVVYHSKAKADKKEQIRKDRVK